MQNFISHKRLYINMTAIANKRQNIKRKLKKPPEKLAQRREVVLLYLSSDFSNVLHNHEKLWKQQKTTLWCLTVQLALKWNKFATWQQYLVRRKRKSRMLLFC